MKKNSRPYSGFARALALAAIAALGLHMTTLPAAGQTKASSLLARFAERRAVHLRVSFAYSPKFPTVGENVQFTETSTGGAVAWHWDFGDGTSSTDRNPVHQYAAPGFRKVTLSVASATISRKVTRTLTVLPATPAATFVYSPATPGPGEVVQFTDTTPGDPTSWSWSFGDGAASTLKNPSHAYAEAGTYTVTLTTRGSSTTKQGSQTITVVKMSVLSSSFTYSPAMPIAGQTVQFTDTSTGGPTSWLWSFNDGTANSTAQNPSHVFAAAGSYAVTLTVTNASGSKSVSRTVTVSAALAASFTFSPASPTAGQAVQFTDTSTGGPTSWLWSFNDGTANSTVQNPSHVFAAAGSYAVTLTVTNASGSKSVSRTVTVSAALTASFTVSPASPTAGQAVQFTDTSTGGPTSWLWSFNDGTANSTAQNPSHVFAAAGSYAVTLTITNASGSTSATRTIGVSPASTLVASFTFSPASPAAGQTVQFTDTSTGSPTSWQWDFGDGTTSSSQHPTHAYTATGSYTVTLVAKGGSGSDSASQSISVVQESTMIPSERKIDWSKAGVWAGTTKGIPAYPVGVTCSSPAYSVYPNQSTSSRAGIQAAINACPAGRAVYLPAGTYRIDGAINLKSGVVLRGAGPGATIILASSSGAGFRATGATESLDLIDTSGTGPDSGNVSGPLSSGYTKGSFTVVLTHAAVAANVSVGQTVLINERNDPDEIVTHQGYEGPCTWAAGGGLRGNGEWKVVASKSGTSITFTRELYFEYKSALLPKLIRYVSSPVVNAGIESLTVDGNGTASQLMRFYGATYCWAKKVEFTRWVQYAANLTQAAVGNEITNCYFHDASAFGGDQGYAVSIECNATDNYVYDNVMKWTKNACTIGSTGGTANVVAYNYSHSTNHWQPWWSKNAYGLHGVHTLFNLFEGNVGGLLACDGAWGSNSRSMVFRNNITGNTNNPEVTMNKLCIEVEALNYWHSFIGNVLGFSGMAGEYQPLPFYDNEKYYIWKIGYVGSSEGQPSDAFTVSSTLRHGNYDYVTKSTKWDATISDHNLPSSLCLDAKPSWFGSLDWPAFGPDVPGYVKTIPAKLRWETYAVTGLISDLFSQ